MANYHDYILLCPIEIPMAWVLERLNHYWGEEGFPDVTLFPSGPAEAFKGGASVATDSVVLPAPEMLNAMLSKVADEVYEDERFPSFNGRPTKVQIFTLFGKYEGADGWRVLRNPLDELVWID